LAGFLAAPEVMLLASRGKLFSVNFGKSRKPADQAAPSTNFRPDLERLRPGSSVLGGSDMIAAGMEEVVDLIVG